MPHAREGRERGVGAVYQEPSLVPELTVLENIFLGRELRSAARVLERKAMRRKAREALERVGARVARLGGRALSVAERQLVEIARALVLEADVSSSTSRRRFSSGPELDRVFK